MAVTRKIKLNSVRVGDPSLIVEFQVEDTGVFPTYVKVVANVTLPNSTTPIQSSGIGQSNVAPNTSTDVTVQCAFPDGTFATGQTFGYSVTSVQFSDDQMTWTTYAGTKDGLSWNSTVQSSRFPGANAEAAVRPPMPNPASNAMSFWDRIVLFFRRLFG